MKLLLILGLGAVGVLARYGVDRWFSNSPSPFPWSIFLINIAGSFVAGLIFSVGVERQQMSSDLTQAILIGLCGGFTTFSTYSIQAVALLLEGHLVAFGLYFLLSPLIALVAALSGVILGRLL